MGLCPRGSASPVSPLALLSAWRVEIPPCLLLSHLLGCFLDRLLGLLDRLLGLPGRLLGLLGRLLGLLDRLLHLLGWWRKKPGRHA